MVENSNKITISFSLDDHFGNKYSSSTTSEIFHELGESEIDFIGEQLNIFLKQCGYYRKNNQIFMKDITEEEWSAIDDYLTDLRHPINKEEERIEK